MCSVLTRQLCFFLLQMVSAVVQEDGYEVSLTISFVSAAQEVKQVCFKNSHSSCCHVASGKREVTECVCYQGDPSGDDAPPAGGVLPAGGTETLSSVTERFSSSLSTNGSYVHFIYWVIYTLDNLQFHH